MITESTIYWILKLDDICILLSAICFVAAAFSFVTLIAWGINASEDNENCAETAKKLCGKSIVVALICATIFTFVPRTKQMAMIKVIPTIANSEIVGEMSADAKELYKMGIKAIKEQLTGKDNNVGTKGKK